jgi:glycerol-3-phosphate O-acyltransferase
VFNGRSTLIRIGERVRLRDYTAAAADPSRAARRLLKDLRAEFRHMRADTIGPELATRRVILSQVLRSRAVRQAVRQEMRDRKITRREALRTARKHALEIAADYSHAFVRVMDRALTWLWTRLYDGVEVRNAERLDHLPAGCEIVYVPCHRSHMDYLLLSYVIYYRGYAVPYVAAGVNLNLPVIGRFLRMGGAFFLRRSFRGSGLYPIVFMKYVDVLMGRGHPIEFFIEGGRSRTGRLLPAKTGMLSMTVRSFLRTRKRPVVYVPVYFGYERSSRPRPTSASCPGRAKEKESILGLLRSLPELRQRFGRVQVSFGEPLPLTAVLERVEPAWRRRPCNDEARPPWFSEAVDALAGDVMRGINAAAAVTPVNLLAVALLSTPRQAMIEADLLRQLQLYVTLMQESPYARACRMPRARRHAAMIRHGEAMGMLERVPMRSATSCACPRKRRSSPTYYRNNVIHLFAMPRWSPAPSSTTRPCAPRTSSALPGGSIRTCARSWAALARGRGAGVVDGRARGAGPAAPARAQRGRPRLAPPADRDGRGRPAVAPRPGDRPDHRALLPGHRAAAARGPRRADGRRPRASAARPWRSAFRCSTG